MEPRVRRRALRAALVGVAMLPAAPADAAPAVLRAADAAIEISAPAACAVRLTVTIDGAAAPIEHRLEHLEGAVTALGGVEGASAEPPGAVGRTLVLRVTPSGPTYTLRYRVTQPPAGVFRCPIWLPATPADGRSRAVRIHATVPAGTAPAGTFPAFAWTDRTGTATLGHLPAFVRVPYAGAGVDAPWNLARLMDGVSLAVLAAASLLWWRRRQRHS
ncbi:MAG: hypothetical protein AB7H93_03320 [Vicinamibacterales bacterium]